MDTKAKKVRCICKRCAKAKMLPASGIDRDEVFLCEPCDDKFAVWVSTTESPERTVARWLEMHPKR